MKKYLTKTHLLVAIAFHLLLLSKKTVAQLNPLGMQYYSNQYLGNPAMAGVFDGLNVNIGFRQQWSGIPGAPATQALTAEYGNNKVGLGLNLYNDAAGLLKRTRVAGTYAYHLPLDDGNRKLHFGLSMSIMSERVENERLDGDDSDASIDRLSRRENYLDGDFGVAYTSGKLNIQGAIPNLQQFIKKDENFKSVDRSLFMSSISYRWDFGEIGAKTSLEPKLAFRGIKGYNNIIDFGFNLGLVNDKISFMGIYHSSKSATFGLGTLFKSFLIMGMYTTETAALNSYLNGEFEFALGYKLGRKLNNK